MYQPAITEIVKTSVNAEVARGAVKEFVRGVIHQKPTANPTQAVEEKYERDLAKFRKDLIQYGEDIIDKVF